jgi:hypothetical protein
MTTACILLYFAACRLVAVIVARLRGIGGLAGCDGSS